MSSLQKFHRRTMSLAPAIKAIGSEAPVAGSGYYAGFAGNGSSYMYVAPKSTETTKMWGDNNYAPSRGNISTTDGLTNTNTLYAYGAVAYPAASYCKTLATGGYNTWYLPAVNELETVKLAWNTSSTFRTITSFLTNYSYYWSSTESGSYTKPWQSRIDYANNNGDNKTVGRYIRAVRRALV